MQFTKTPLLTIAAILLTTLAGCSFFQEDEVYSLSKCGMAANILQDNELLRATDYKAQTVLKDTKGSAKQAMKIGEKLREETQPQGSSSDPRHTLKVAQKWRDSSYCQSATKEFGTYVHAKVAAYLTPAMADVQANNSCKVFQDHYAITYRDQSTLKFKSELEQALKNRIDGQAGLLKSFQKEFVASIKNSRDLEALGGQISAQCKLGGELSSAITSSPILRNLKSPITGEILAQMNAQPRSSECGDLAQVFCSSSVASTALQKAYRASVACDQLVGSDSSCFRSAAEFVSNEIKAIEVPLLKAARQKTMESITAARASIETGRELNQEVRKLAIPCQSAAIGRGVKNYYDYSKTVCIPAAFLEFVKPHQDLLSAIDTRLSRHGAS